MGRSPSPRRCCSCFVWWARNVCSASCLGSPPSRSRQDATVRRQRIEDERVVTVETERDVEGLKRVGRAVAAVLREMLDSIEPGMTTGELDGIGRALLARHGAQSAPELAYKFPGATCISINEEAAHGI